MARNPYRLYTMLDRIDLAVLRGVEALSSRYEYVPVEVLERRTRVPPHALARSLDKLNQLGLVRRRLGGLSGYKLTYYGLDVLAYAALHARGVLDALGEKLGVGKEGEVYLGLTPSGDLVVVKFHREGRRSFSKIKRYRDYAARVDRKQWFRIAKLAGEREFKALVALREEGALVPRPIAWNRHAVVEELIPGVELYRIRELGDPDRVFWDVAETLRIAYTRVGIVHGDLSEYNVLVSEEGRGYVIDWPQYVYREEPQADELLRRDVEYLASFFRRRFNLNVDPRKVLEYVRGEGDGGEA